MSERRKQGGNNQGADMQDAKKHDANRDEDRRAAANRLMDVITDLDDDLVLEAEEPIMARKPGKQNTGQQRKRWFAVGISVAAVIVAGLIALGIYLGRPGRDDRPIDGATTEAGITEAGATEVGITEAGITEAGVTEAGATEAGITEAGATEAGVTEAGATEAGATEAGVTEAGVTEDAATEVITETVVTETITETGATEAGRTGNPEKENAKHVDVGIDNVEAKTVSFESLEEMEGYADVILRAVRLDQEEPVVSGPYTFSKVKISKIYKDNAGELAEDREITVLENEVYDAAQDVVYHVAGYNMMVAGEEYLLFLRHNVLPDGKEYYVACGVNFGTISLTDDGRDRVRGNEGPGPYEVDEPTPEMKTIWEEAKRKYQ